MKSDTRYLVMKINFITLLSEGSQRNMLRIMMEFIPNEAQRNFGNIHGNVKTLLQDNKKLAVGNSQLADQQFKRMDYNYDLISGNVHSVSYQKEQADAWHHAYEYDADNRITNVYTSTNTVGTTLSPSFVGQGAGGSIVNQVIENHLWDNDAKYEYYAHGPLARMETGDNQVQGCDYVYTLQGWIKGVNSNTLDAERDPGKDGVSTSSTASQLNHNFARDVYGYSLNYFTNDYQSIDVNNQNTASFTASITGSDVEANRHDLFNGNIGSMITTITNPTTRDILPLGNSYKYDQLNRLLEARSYNNLDLNTNSFGSGGSEMYFNAFSYDANGNMESALAYDDVGNILDDQTYHYQTIVGNKRINNRLYAISDLSSDNSKYGLSDTQDAFDNTDATINSVNNYRYDEIGQLVYNEQDEIQSVKWAMFNKPQEIIRTPGSQKRNVRFDYDGEGLRVAKHIFTSNDLFLYSEYYVHDIDGRIISVYRHETDNVGQTISYHQSEKHIDGNAGICKEFVEMIGTITNLNKYTRTLGNKNYSLSSHNGNVLSVITDKKIPVESLVNSGEVEYFIVELLSSQDYTPFGGDMKGRDFNSSEFPNSFNGKRDDEELGDWQDYGVRVYMKNTRRFFNTDPIASKYPMLSTYQFASNSPIWAVDMDGLEAYFIHGTGRGPEVWDEYKDESNNGIRHAIRETFGNIKHKDEVELFKWNKHNNSFARSRAIKRLIKHIEKTHVAGEPITLVGHSHGGNIALMAADKLRKMYPDEQINLVTMNTPVRDDYQLTVDACTEDNLQHLNFYVGNDDVVKSEAGYSETGKVNIPFAGIPFIGSFIKPGLPPQFFVIRMALAHLLHPFPGGKEARTNFMHKFGFFGGEAGPAGLEFTGAENYEVPSPVEVGEENLLNKGTRHRIWNEDNGANFIKVLKSIKLD